MVARRARSHGRHQRHVVLFLLGAGAALPACSGADRSLLEPEGAERDESDSASGVSSHCASIGQSAAALSVVDRSLVGSPGAYTPDREIAAREAELVASAQLRRRTAWQIAERVLTTMPLRAELGPRGRAATLPAWQTWHAKDDITRIFRRVYPQLGLEDKAARAELPAPAVDAAWEWNDGAIADFEDWTDERLDAYRQGIDETSEVAGLGGIYRVSYSPAASRHLLASYDDVLGCMEHEPASDAVPSSGACEAVPPVCLDGQFPDAAVIVKASWRRADLGTRLPVFDTSAAGLARRLSDGREFSWGEADGDADPSPDEIYTLRTPNGNAFRLAGLHIMSKELEHWFWITLWWSPDASSDFGADRPSTLPAPFDHYKLCSVVAFTESDPDPAAGPAGYPSLAAALAATHAGAGGPTWCSNPYLEVGAGNAATNCIGCHQHAGTRLGAEDILRSAEEFPEFGRTLVRATFPSDYVFSATRGDNLGAMFEETEDHWLSSAASDNSSRQ